MIQTPNHGSLPSGHSTEAHAVAWVISALVTTHSTAANTNAQVQLREILMRQAARIAINRTVAGVHYPVDSMAGQMLGLTIGEYFVARAQPAANATDVVAWNFRGTEFKVAGSNPLTTFDFTGNELFDATRGVRLDDKDYAIPIGGRANPAKVPVTGSANLNWLWEQASDEWKKDR